MEQLEPQASAQFTRLQDILKQLRAPDGCPWDRKQTPTSIQPNLIEEMYELIDAIAEGDALAIREELGDLYLLVTLMASIYEEQEAGFLAKTLQELNEKLIRRHPHVFGDKVAHTPEESLAHWQAVKAQEVAKGKAPAAGGTLARLGRGLPPLEKANVLQHHADKMGFHWDTPAEIFLKVEEEFAELQEAVSQNQGEARITEELGDLLFVISCLAGKLQIDPSQALHVANNKFLSRFGFVQEELAKKGLSPSLEVRDQMEAAWQLAKTVAKK